MANNMEVEQFKINGNYVDRWIIMLIDDFSLMLSLI